jgi:hypothetical protein
LFVVFENGKETTRKRVYLTLGQPKGERLIHSMNHLVQKSFLLRFQSSALLHFDELFVGMSLTHCAIQFVKPFNSEGLAKDV